MSNLLNVSPKAQSVLKTLCSNYRGSMRVKAQFRCSVHYGLKSFIAETGAYLSELKAAGLIASYRISEDEKDDEGDLCYFSVTADLNLSVEEMAEISANSQTIFQPTREKND
ncbi:MAG: hypothetical protein FWH03_02155 [Firmicutes bacterium]|nr:hypothetical protein [Bacillota bacterium]